MDAAEDATLMRHGAYVWEASTRNTWTLTVAGIHVASVRRSPSWRRLGEPRPWYVEIFGTRFVTALSGDKNFFRTLDAARIKAEKVLKQMVHNLDRVLTDAF